MCEMRSLCEITKIMINQSVFVISLKEVMSQRTIRSIYFRNVRSHLMCGLAFGRGGAEVLELMAAMNYKRGLCE